MKIIHTSDFKNNTILAHRGIKCVIRGYAFVKDTKKWLAKKYQDRYAFEDITLEELCNNCTLITDEDKNDPDVLNNLFDVTYEPCLELTVPETTDEKGTVLGGEKFGTYKIRINSSLNNKIRKGIQGTYRAIVLIGEKYTEDDWHVITENKSYIAMFIYFDGSSPECQGEDTNGLTIGENSAYTINLQFSLSQLKDIPAGETVKLDADYAKIMSESNQKDQTTIKLALPGIFLVPSGKEYKNRVEIEDGVKREHEGIAYMDKTFNLIPNTYKNNNIFNVTPRVNIFDEHDDKFVKPQMLLSYGKKQEDGTFDAQSIGFEYDPRYFKMNEKAPSAATRFDLFGGATKRETSTYDDTRYDPMSGYLRLLCDRGYNIGGQDNLFIKANDVYTDMSHGSMIIADDNRVVDNTQTTHIIDSRGTRASGLSAGHIIDSEKIYAQGMDGFTAFASQQASATTALPGYDRTKDDPYMCPDCQGTGKINGTLTRYVYIGTFRIHSSDPMADDDTVIFAIGQPVENPGIPTPCSCFTLQTYRGALPADYDFTADINAAIIAERLPINLMFNTEANAEAILTDEAKSYIYNYFSHTITYIGTAAGQFHYSPRYVVAMESGQYTVRIFYNDDYGYLDNEQIGVGSISAVVATANVAYNKTFETEAAAREFIAQNQETVLHASVYERMYLPCRYLAGFVSRSSSYYVAYKNANGNAACLLLGTGSDYASLRKALRESDLITDAMSFETEADAQAFCDELEADWPFEVDIASGNHPLPGVREFPACVIANTEPCPRCGGDGRYGNYSMPGRLAMMGLNVSSMEFNGYNNFFIGHKGLMSNFGHDAVIFGNHNACGNKEYNMCQTCLGTGLVECSACKNGTDHPTGKVSAHPNVTCSSCYGFGYVNYSAEICGLCHGRGKLDDDSVCPICLGHNSHSGVDPKHWDTFYTCSAYTAVADAIYQCQLCGGTKEIVDESQTVEVLCPECSGYGQMKDPVCSGMGFIQDNEHQMQSSACPTCSETMMACPVCSGRGYSGDETSGDRCDFCEGDKRVCVVCEGTGEHACKLCEDNDPAYFHDIHWITCPECGTNKATAAECITCPICEGADIVEEGDDDDRAPGAYVSVTKKADILKFLPKGGSKTGNAEEQAWSMLLRKGGNACSRCNGTGHIREKMYAQPYIRTYVESTIVDVPVGYLKVDGEDVITVNTTEEATLFETYAAAADAYNTWVVDHPEVNNYTVIIITEDCPDCGGTGSTDGTILCPCCNELIHYSYNLTTEGHDHISPTDVSPQANVVMKYDEYTDPYQTHYGYVYGCYPSLFLLVDNSYCGTPGKITPKPRGRLGYHKCDLCDGKKYLADTDYDKLIPYLGDDAKEKIYEWAGSRFMSHAASFIFVGYYTSDNYGMLCPKCCNMNILKDIIKFNDEHHIDQSLVMKAYVDAFSEINQYDSFSHENMEDAAEAQPLENLLYLDGGYDAACNACNYQGKNSDVYTLGKIKCPECDGTGVVPCEACNGLRHWLCPTCNGRGEVDYRPIVAYEDGKVIAVGDGYFYKNLMTNQDDFNMYRDYVNIKPENNCDLDVGQYLKRMNLFSVENHGLLTVHNNNYDEVPDSNVVHQVAADFFAVRSWAKYDSLQERFANLQNGCYAPDAIYFTKRTAHNEEWKLRIRELDYLIHDSYIKTNASWLKTAALNQAISEFYKKNNTFTLRLGPIITYAWKGVKGSKGAKGTKGWKGRKGVKGVTLGLKGKKGMKGMKGLKGTKGYKGMTLQIVNKRYKYYIEDILAAVQTEFGKYISNNGNLGKNPETYTFYCINGDPTENLYFKGVRLRKMANGNYQTLNAVKGIKPAEVQRIIYKDNGYYGEYGVMNFNYAYSNKFLT